MTMQIETARQFLKLIREGKNTVSDLILAIGRHSVSRNLGQLEALEFVKREDSGRRKPYKLTKRGEKFLAVFE